MTENLSLLSARHLAQCINKRLAKGHLRARAAYSNRAIAITLAATGGPPLRVSISECRGNQAMGLKWFSIAVDGDAAHVPQLRARLKKICRIAAEETGKYESLLEKAGLGTLIYSPHDIFHSGYRTTDLVLRITYRCNQRCPFCFQPMDGREIPAVKVISALKFLRKRFGVKSATLSGGEPTLHGELFKILAAGRKLGVALAIQTNGTRLASSEFTQRLHQLGVRTFFISIHASSPREYNAVTGTTNQLPLALRGIANALSLPKTRVLALTVLNRANRACLHRHAALLCALAAKKRRHLNLFFSQPNATTYDCAPESTLDFASAKAALLKTAAVLREARYCKVHSKGICALPPCLLKNVGARFSRNDNRDTSYIGRYNPQGRGMLKKPACRTCRLDNNCPGVPHGYARLYGLGALKPV